MLREIDLMKAERAAAAAGSWSDSEEPSHSDEDEDEESQPLVQTITTTTQVPPAKQHNDDLDNLKPKQKAVDGGFMNLSTKQLIIMWAVLQIAALFCVVSYGLRTLNEDTQAMSGGPISGD